MELFSISQKYEILLKNNFLQLFFKEKDLNSLLLWKPGRAVNRFFSGRQQKAENRNQMLSFFTVFVNL
jgi:hypothetical protein